MTFPILKFRIDSALDFKVTLKVMSDYLNNIIMEFTTEKIKIKGKEKYQCDQARCYNLLDCYTSILFTIDTNDLNEYDLQTENIQIEFNLDSLLKFINKATHEDYLMFILDDENFEQMQISCINRYHGITHYNKQNINKSINNINPIFIDHEMGIYMNLLYLFKHMDKLLEKKYYGYTKLSAYNEHSGIKFEGLDDDDININNNQYNTFYSEMIYKLWNARIISQSICLHLPNEQFDNMVVQFEAGLLGNMHIQFNTINPKLNIQKEDWNKMEIEI
jgi:hypothetical protein